MSSIKIIKQKSWYLKLSMFGGLDINHSFRSCDLHYYVLIAIVKLVSYFLVFMYVLSGLSAIIMVMSYHVGLTLTNNTLPFSKLYYLVGFVPLILCLFAFLARINEAGKGTLSLILVSTNLLYAITILMATNNFDIDHGSFVLILFWFVTPFMIVVVLDVIDAYRCALRGDGGLIVNIVDSTSKLFSLIYNGLSQLVNRICNHKHYKVE